MTSPEQPGSTDGGSSIRRYDAVTGPRDLSNGDDELIARVSAHVERHLGPVEHVFHELISPTVHVDIHWVAPTRARPWHTLVTSGMSERPMKVPEGLEGCEYAELLISLPASWPLTMEAFEDEANYWPLRWLKQLARFPHEYETWVWNGHTIPNGDPPEPFAPSTELCTILLAPPAQAPEEFFRLDAGPGRTIHFWSLVPLYREEMDLKLRDGADALLDRFDSAGIGELVDLRRPNVAGQRRWWSFFRR